MTSSEVEWSYHQIFFRTNCKHTLFSDKCSAVVFNCDIFILLQKIQNGNKNCVKEDRNATTTFISQENKHQSRREHVKQICVKFHFNNKKWLQSYNTSNRKITLLVCH